MPMYEYHCEACGKNFEVIQKFSDAPLERCLDENCGGEMKKLMSSTSFALKGAGWYTTDYKKKNSSESGSSQK